MNAKVSVILPSLNVADYIRECLDSVVNQPLRELEIICVDAGSTDGTAEILKEYAGRDARIVLLESGIKSYGRQVNMGLDYASGEYVAVLETDDWVEGDMYGRLYRRAAADHLDYAAADFDTFFLLQSGCGYFARQRIFSGSLEGWYGEILDSPRIATLRSTDYVLWKGIYNREFLNANGIRLNESPGAAFQDMGFLQQVKSYAGKAVYIDESFYRYRQNRDTASSGCLEGLRYYEREFQWLEGLACIRALRGDHQKYYYFTMSIAFLTKYEQILWCLRGEWRDERLGESYGWFREQILRAADRGLLDETMYGKELWERLMLLLKSREAHAGLTARKCKAEAEVLRNFLRVTGGRPVVIFGCGVRGERLMLFCDRNNIPISGFSDNNALLQGTKRFGFPVMPPVELGRRLEETDGVVLLSMRAGAGEVRRQLEQSGIASWRVLDVPQGAL